MLSLRDNSELMQLAREGADGSIKGTIRRSEIQLTWPKTPTFEKPANIILSVPKLGQLAA